jgi:WD40 repeat protein
MDEVIKIWDMSRNMSGPTLSDHNGELLTLRFTSDDNFLLAGGEDGRLRIWKKTF